MVARGGAQKRACSNLLRPLLCCRRRVEHQRRGHVGEALRVEPATVRDEAATVRDEGCNRA